MKDSWMIHESLVDSTKDWCVIHGIMYMEGTVNAYMKESCMIHEGYLHDS
jgi:hypothetical protein